MAMMMESGAAVRRVLVWVLLVWGATGSLAAAEDEAELFRTRIAPLFERRCLSCHNASEREGGLSLATAEDFRTGGDSGTVVEPGDADASYLLDLVTPSSGSAEMPKNADPLSADDVADLRRWVEQGAEWPDDLVLVQPAVSDTDWWSLRPLERPLPPVEQRGAAVHNAIDLFVARRLADEGLSFAPPADRRTLIRRLYFDLLGLPPTPQEIAAFQADTHPAAYEGLVDRLLASPRYGERWARHWLDVVHYGDTHGYDKDKPRPHAWPYRDYVIRALNADKPWSRFVQEQIAGDALFPGTLDGNTALGFIAAGPWDFVGHAEVPETKIDGQVARHLDRDDMVRTTMQSFCALTVGCAQCHHHKFDPIRQEEYYGLQAVFAALDRADRAYYADPELDTRYRTLLAGQRKHSARREEIERAIRERAGEELAVLDAKLAQRDKSAEGNPAPEYGYHSAIEQRQDVVKWVQIDLGRSLPLRQIVAVPAYDSFNKIGAGFGFPRRYRIEVSNDAAFDGSAECVADYQAQDQPNPGLLPQEFPLQSTARYVRFTATRLAPRKDDYIFALAELQIIDEHGRNAALGGLVTSLDSIEAPPRWGRANLVDGVVPNAGHSDQRQQQLAAREALWQQHSSSEERAELSRLQSKLATLDQELRALPEPQRVYAGTVHHGSGAFAGTGPQGGRPRPIHVLSRGDVTRPGPVAAPRALAVFENLDSTFDLPPDHDESARRVALARWISANENPITWRAAANRVWQYHFGKGLAAMPNDLGRMGAEPTHPELLDWLAAELRDSGESLKRLHRLIVTSRTYRQASTVEDAARGEEVDAENRLLWHMPRRRLEAEAIRDAVLAVSGMLDLQMGGPAFQDFVIEKPEHSPHYQYHLHDPADPRSHRRSVYRFIVRSQLQPFMTTLDCADPSLQVAQRSESQTPLQALTMLNNGLMVTASARYAARLEARFATPPERVNAAFREALGRAPSEEEREALETLAAEHGLANVCRLIFNLNEFMFVD